MFKSIAGSEEINIMPEGDYEVYVKDCCFSTTKGGYECIKFEFVVRDDVEQPFKKFHKFKQFYRDRDTNAWPVDKIGRYANALGIPNGKDFDLSDLIGLNAVMVIRNYNDKNTGEKKDNIYYLKPSKQKPFMSSSSFVEVDEDDFDGEVTF